MKRKKDAFSHRKGKTLEEEYGIERAIKIRERMRESHLGHTPSNKGHGNVKKECKLCKKVFVCKIYTNRLYCSRSCAQKSKDYSYLKGKKHSLETIEKVRLSMLGKICSKETKKKISEGNKGKEVGEETKQKISLAMQGKKSWNKGIQHKKISGKNHWNWKGGISAECDNLGLSLEWKTWREKVFKRDKFLCQMCKEKKKILHPHHIIPVTECLFIDYKELIFDVDNGLTLCEDCHLRTGLHKGLQKRRLKC